MKSANCRMISVGIETGSKEIQAIINKNINLEKARQTIRMIEDIGIGVVLLFIVGLPGESINMVRESAKFIRRTGVKNVFVRIFQVYPGCSLYLTFVKGGYISDDYWRYHDTAPFFDIENKLSTLRRYAFLLEYEAMRNRGIKDVIKHGLEYIRNEIFLKTGIKITRKGISVLKKQNKVYSLYSYVHRPKE